MSIDRTTANSRFAFGKNWKRFLQLVDEDKIAIAEKSLKQLLAVTDLEGKRFVDIGSGSGLFSLAARNLGANVISFDYDNDSVACTEELKNNRWPGDEYWTVEQGSVLDKSYIRSLGKFDLVYSWGVLHHTGDMWAAFHNVTTMVEKGGRLVIAIYNDQGWLSKYWLGVKRIYNVGPISKLAVMSIFAPYFTSRRVLKSIILPSAKDKRGMDFWRDVVDWLGGYPFEVAKPEQLVDYFNSYGFELEKLNTVGNRLGCNEFVFRKTQGQAS